MSGPEANARASADGSALRSLTPSHVAFPGLDGRTYLNSCSLGLPPASAREVYPRWAALMERFHDDAFGVAFEEMLAFIGKLERLIGASPGTVWVDQSSSALLGRLLASWPLDGRRTRVVTSALEFPSVELMLRSSGRFDVVAVPARDHAIDEARVVEAIDDRTAFVLLSHATTATGCVLDTRPIAEACARHGAVLGLDAYQSVGAIPVDVAALGADFLVGGAHKWLLGAWDLGYAWVAPERLAALRPALPGWFAGENPTTFDVQRRLAPDARRLAMGTPAPLPAMVSSVGLDVVTSVGIDAIATHAARLRAHVEAAADARGLVVAGRGRPHAGHVGLVLPDCGRIVGELARRHIVVSHRPSGGERVVRVAPHLYSSSGDLDALFDALDDVLAPPSTGSTSSGGSGSSTSSDSSDGSSRSDGTGRPEPAASAAPRLAPDEPAASTREGSAPFRVQKSLPLGDLRAALVRDATRTRPLPHRPRGRRSDTPRADGEESLG